MKIKVNKLRELVVNSMLKKYGREDSEMMADLVMFGELSGRTSHGLNRLLLGAGILSMTPIGKPEIKSITKLSSKVLGNGNPGMLVGQIAMNEVIKIAKENDFGMVGSVGSFSSSGALTYYLEKITNEGFIGIIMAESPRSTPPLWWN